MAQPAPLPAVPKGWQEVIAVIRVSDHSALAIVLPEPGMTEPPPQPPLCPDAESGFSGLPVQGPAPPALVREDKSEGPLSPLGKGGSLPTRAPLWRQETEGHPPSSLLSLDFQKLLAISCRPWFQASEMQSVTLGNGRECSDLLPNHRLGDLAMLGLRKVAQLLPLQPAGSSPANDFCGPNFLPSLQAELDQLCALGLCSEEACTGSPRKPVYPASRPWPQER